MMMYLVEGLLAHAFKKEFGKWQSKKEEKDRRGMIVALTLSTDYEKEEGYRNLHIFLYGECNYIKVLKRETWDVAPIKQEMYNGHNLPGGEIGEYEKGASDWELLVDHDSCWKSDGLHRVLWEYRERIVTFSSNFGFEPYSGISLAEAENLGLIVNKYRTGFSSKENGWRDNGERDNALIF